MTAQRQREDETRNKNDGAQFRATWGRFFWVLVWGGNLVFFLPRSIIVIVYVSCLFDLFPLFWFSLFFFLLYNTCKQFEEEKKFYNPCCPRSYAASYP
jgi:hypothetical protein